MGTIIDPKISQAIKNGELEYSYDRRNMMMWIVVNAKVTDDLDFVFDLPNAEQLIERAIQVHQISEPNLIRVLELKNAKELMTFYLKKYYVNASVAVCLLDTPDVMEYMEILVEEKRVPWVDFFMEKLVNHPKEEELVKLLCRSENFFSQLLRHHTVTSLKPELQLWLVMKNIKEKQYKEMKSPHEQMLILFYPNFQCITEYAKTIPHRLSMDAERLIFERELDCDSEFVNMYLGRWKRLHKETWKSLLRRRDYEEWVATYKNSVDPETFKEFFKEFRWAYYKAYLRYWLT